ncbi:hypothetical protein RJZ90_004552 [Blastomyces dermatitidis]
MAPVHPLHRHQSSIEGIINFSPPQPFTLGQRVRAQRRFYDIIHHFRAVDNSRSHHTPQPSPAHLSVIQNVQGRREFTGTPDRISVLRGSCLIRDHHRCDYSKKAALMILHMFDSDVSHLVDGIDIDQPFNAMSLTHDLHALFSNFKVFFEPVPGQEHTYQIDTFLPPGILQDIPVTCTLYLTDNQSIDPPSSRLLALHCAIAHILHLSGAGEYIDSILRDMETGIQGDGSTELGHIVKYHVVALGTAESREAGKLEISGES